MKWVGPHGASIAYLQQRLKESNIKTTWAENSARNCIASILGHDKAFVKLPKHGHYALALYNKTDAKDEASEKRELPSNENEVSSYPRNNAKCLICHKVSIQFFPFLKFFENLLTFMFRQNMWIIHL